MPRVNFRDASKNLEKPGSLIRDARLMEAVPPINARVRFAHNNFEPVDPVGRVVDQIWHISLDNPNDVVVDVIVALE